MKSSRLDSGGKVVYTYIQYIYIYTVCRYMSSFDSNKNDADLIRCWVWFDWNLVPEKGAKISTIYEK